MDELGKRLAQGDHAAFAELYDACADRIHHYLMVFLGSKEDSEDVLQETFIRLAGNCKRLAKVENLTAYIFTIARNEALRLIGRRKTAESLDASITKQCLFEPVKNNPFQEHDCAEAAAIALGGLEVDLREVVELKHFAALTFREIADVTGCPQGNAVKEISTVKTGIYTNRRI